VRRSWANWIGLSIILLALVIGILAQSVFFAAVRHVVGAAPLRPPFLMARTIEDGPGYRYIRATCPSNGFKVCEFADRLPLMADDFLWKSGPTGYSPRHRRKSVANCRMNRCASCLPSFDTTLGVSWRRP